jgi:DNA invertase Pin-like site-specific DNA recombinase
MRAAIYARYSSETCSPTSIADQIESCRRFAAKNNLEISDEHIYHDDAVSVREMKDQV